MRVVKVTGFKRCVDGTILREYTVDCPVTREAVADLEKFGTVKIMDEIRQPFYTFAKEEFFTIKGMIGDATLYVRFKKETMNETTPYLEKLIAQCGGGNPDAAALEACEQESRGNFRILFESG